MDMVVLKKKLSTFLSSKGYLTNVSDDVLFEVLTAWENWPGTSKEFYRGIGFSQKQLAGIVGKAKKLKREGHFGSSDFKQVAVGGEDPSSTSSPSQALSAGSAAEVVWKDGTVIRFSGVDLLLDFLRKSS